MDESFLQAAILACVIPIVLVLSLAVLRAIIRNKALTLADHSKIAVEIVFVSMGAAGDSFRRAAALGSTSSTDAVIYVFGVFVLDLALAIAILYFERFRAKPTWYGCISTLGLSGASVLLVIVIPVYSIEGAT